jgi:hypothetical protein
MGSFTHESFSRDIWTHFTQKSSNLGEEISKSKDNCT